MDKPGKTVPACPPSGGVSDAPSDTERLDKIELIEKQVRGRKWFRIEDGMIICSKEQPAGISSWRSLRSAIDACPIVGCPDDSPARVRNSGALANLNGAIAQITLAAVYFENAGHTKQEKAADRLLDLACELQKQVSA
jgi:hypothetical protein